MELIVTGAAVVLVILKVLAALVVPIEPPVKLRLAGATVTGPPPVPVMLTKVKRLLLLSNMLSEPGLEPSKVGVKETFAVHELPNGAILPPQLSVEV